MKRLLFLPALFLLWGTFAFAQFDDVDNDRIQKMRIEFFNNELQFTSEEAQAFWPVYQEFKADQHKLKTSYKANRKMELMTDAEAEDYLNQHLELEEKQLALKRQYIDRLKGVISIRKIAMINRTERKFKQALLNKIQDRRANGNRRKGFN